MVMPNLRRESPPLNLHPEQLTTGNSSKYSGRSRSNSSSPLSSESSPRSPGGRLSPRGARVRIEIDDTSTMQQLISQFKREMTNAGTSIDQELVVRNLDEEILDAEQTLFHAGVKDMSNLIVILKPRLKSGARVARENLIVAHQQPVLDLKVLDNGHFVIVARGDCKVSPES